MSNPLRILKALDQHLTEPAEITKRNFDWINRMDRM